MAGLVNFTIDVQNNRLPELRALGRRRASMAVRTATIGARNHSIPHTPVKTNQLRMRVDIQFSDGGLTGIARWLMPYAVFQELGTRRIIRPVRAKFLAFKGKDGKMIFVKQVRGVTGKHFAKKGAQAVTPAFKTELDAAYRLGGL